MNKRFDAWKSRLTKVGAPAASVALLTVAVAVYFLKGPSAGTHPMWERTRDRLLRKGARDGNDDEGAADKAGEEPSASDGD